MKVFFTVNDIIQLFHGIITVKLDVLIEILYVDIKLILNWSFKAISYLLNQDTGHYLNVLRGSNVKIPTSI